MQKPSVQRVVARHALDLSGVQHHAFAWLGKIGEANTRQPCDHVPGVRSSAATLTMLTIPRPVKAGERR